MQYRHAALCAGLPVINHTNLMSDGLHLHHVLYFTRLSTWSKSFRFIHGQPCCWSQETWCRPAYIRWWHAIHMHCRRSDMPSTVAQLEQTLVTGCLLIGLSWMMRKRNCSGRVHDMDKLRSVAVVRHYISEQTLMCRVIKSEFSEWQSRRTLA